jgi:parallel beta-helix repeat protein
VSGTKIRITIKARTDQDTAIAGTSIGVMTTNEVYDAVPTRITWDGGSSTTTILAGQTRVSDEITFTFTKTNRHGVSIYTGTGAHYIRGIPTSVGDGSYWNWTDGDVTMVQDIDVDGSHATISYGLELLEVYSAAANTWQAACTTEPGIVFFDGTKGIKETSVANLSADTEWFWASNVLSVYSTSDPDTAYTSPGIEAGTRDNAINISAKNYITVDGFKLLGTNAHIVPIAGSITGVTIKNCEMCYNAGTAQDGIIWWLTGGGANTVDSCVIHHIAGDGITWFDTYSGSGTESYLKNSTIYETTKFGGYLKANYLIIENNLVYNCGVTGTAGWGIGIQCEAADSGTGLHCIVRYNRIYGTRGDDTDGTGIQLDHWTAYNQVYGNVISGCDGQGIIVYNSHDNVIYNNSSYGNVQRATFSNARTEIGLSANAGSLNYNNIVKNNVAQATTANTYAIYVDASSYSQTGQSISNNCWYATATNWYFWNASGGNNLATWNAFTGVGTDLNSDPLFTNAAGGDFTLQAGSPCIEKGVNLGSTYLEMLLSLSTWPGSVSTGDWHKTGGAPDVGAYGYRKLIW